MAIADDHDLFRQGLKSVLKDKFEVVFDVPNGLELIRKLEDYKVDIVLLDLEMPGMDGFETLNLLRSSHPDVKCLMLSYFSETDFIVRAIQLNARGFLPKNATIEQLEKAIHCVSDNGYYFDEALQYIVPIQKKSNYQFTNKETAIIRLACSGITNKEIASKLGISIKTVENHRSSIFEKAQIKNIAQLVLIAIQEGIVVI
jgi:DNA-binding NarL/FixJ family response regulator